VFYFVYPPSIPSEQGFTSALKSTGVARHLQLIDWRSSTQTLELRAPGWQANPESAPVSLHAAVIVEQEVNCATLNHLITCFTPSDSQHFEDLNFNCERLMHTTHLKVPHLWANQRVVFVPHRVWYTFDWLPDAEVARMLQLVGVEADATALTALFSAAERVGAPELSLCCRQSALTFFGSTQLPMSMSVFTEAPAGSRPASPRTYLCVVHTLRLVCLGERPG